MKVRVNGTDHQLGEQATVAEVLTLLAAPSTGIAVALDGAVVPRASWAETELREGSVVEVLTAVQGG
ncbi:sulfur carrier protein ThiS [Crossiella sp. CA-258035]|uniref:sulfur carrier protein ThiS n=1 Tax=Crossiella sp. CA-258035 TaxID=2981138 RepID=UPI0024BCCA97|nr:sulfur carrier protein ThiS [Crossiella sp. CA-258035]WHT19941.1 sulfur carrier protein ThiS [Crossiella sp. CA-258035]